MSKGTHCFEVLLEGRVPAELPGVLAAYGDDAFLRRETARRLLELKGFEPEDYRTFDGEEAKWLDIHDELATLSLFGGDSRRVAVVTSADKLVKTARPQLEKWCAAPPASSLLVLQLHSFPANTKLFKLIDKLGGCIHCGLPTGGGRSKTPSLAEVKRWISRWGEAELKLKLTTTQAALVLDAVGPDCGLLHQELSKLALYADERGKLSDDRVRQNVGSWRTRTMWEIADAIADGNIANALEQLERVFASGEHPAAVIPQVSWSLRRYAKAAHLILQAKRLGTSLSAQAAVGQSGFWGNDAKLAEQRLKRMGLRRASSLQHWLLDLDLKIKGSHSTPSRAVLALEQVCMQFADA